MKNRLGIVGCGRLSNIVVDALLGGMLPEYELIGAYSRTFASAEALAARVGGCKACKSMEELFDLNVDYIVEAASPAAMRELCIPALSRGISIVTLSVGAFAEDAFYEEVKAAAVKGGAKVYIASGATGGFDVLRTATLMGNATAEFFNEKGPRGLRGTPVYSDELLTQQKTVFKGTAKEAIGLFPTRVNVTVAASRASVGPEKMNVTMQSSPYFTGDTQRVEIRNDQVYAVVDIYSATAEIAGWSAVNVLQKIVSPIVF